jgi:hypothetical protein
MTSATAIHTPPSTLLTLNLAIERISPEHLRLFRALILAVEGVLRQHDPEHIRHRKGLDEHHLLPTMRPAHHPRQRGLLRAGANLAAGDMMACEICGSVLDKVLCGCHLLFWTMHVVTGVAFLFSV